MITRGNFKTAAASLRTSKGRSFLTMLGIIIGISSVVTIVSLGEGLKHQIVGQIDNLGHDVLTIRSGKITNSNNMSLNLLGFLSTSTLTSNDIVALQKIPHTGSVTPISFVTNSVSVDDHDTNDVYVIGTNSYMAGLMNQKVAYGNFLSDDPQSKNLVVIGNDIAHNLYGQLNPVGKNIVIKGRVFIIHGVLEKTTSGLLSVAQVDFNSAVFMPMAAAQEVAGNSLNILQILYKPESKTGLDAAVASITSSLQATHGHDDFSVIKQNQLQKVADGMINKLTGSISGIAAISLLVGGIGIMDIMLVSVTERNREIGIRKAVGATNQQILSQFLVEGLVLSFIGGVVGIAVSLLINLVLKIYTGWQPIISLKMMLLAVSVSVIVGLIFSTAPALKAARKDPIDALRA